MSDDALCGTIRRDRRTDNAAERRDHHAMKQTHDDAARASGLPAAQCVEDCRHVVVFQTSDRLMLPTHRTEQAHTPK